VLIKKIHLKDFRCFLSRQFDFDGQFVVVQGKNGSGKTSLLEALHYSSYLSSFKTYRQQDLISLNGNGSHFFIKVDVDLELSGTQDTIQIGYSKEDGKLVRFNTKHILSHRELVQNYRIISLNADNINLVSGAPELRREFLNYAGLVIDPSLIKNFKQYKQILSQRNEMLKNVDLHIKSDFNQQFYVWSKELWKVSSEIQYYRKKYLNTIEEMVNNLLQKYFTKSDSNLRIFFEYKMKNILEGETFDFFWKRQEKRMRETELRLGRGQFGAHLDDFLIVFQEKNARVFASRGQQKLIVFLIKVAQLQQTLSAGEQGVLLLDDFLTDFDASKISECLNLLSTLDAQVFITVPTTSEVLMDGLKGRHSCIVTL
jgi:DNA replication and repair protein RecF